MQIKIAALFLERNSSSPVLVGSTTIYLSFVADILILDAALKIKDSKPFSQHDQEDNAPLDDNWNLTAGQHLHAVTLRSRRSTPKSAVVIVVVHAEDGQDVVHHLRTLIGATGLSLSVACFFEECSGLGSDRSGLSSAVDIAICTSTLCAYKHSILDLSEMQLAVWTNAKRILAPERGDLPEAFVNSVTDPKVDHRAAVTKFAERLHKANPSLRHLVLTHGVGKATVRALKSDVLNPGRSRPLLEIGLGKEKTINEDAVYDTFPQKRGREHFETLDSDSNSTKRQRNFEDDCLEPIPTDERITGYSQPSATMPTGFDGGPLQQAQGMEAEEERRQRREATFSTVYIRYAMSIDRLTNVAKPILGSLSDSVLGKGCQELVSREQRSSQAPCRDSMRYHTNRGLRVCNLPAFDYDDLPRQRL